MKYNKGFAPLILVAIIVGVLVIGGGVYYFVNKNVDKVLDSDKGQSIEILDNKDDLISFSVKPGESVSGILKLSGSVKGGYFNEGEIRIRLLDSSKNVFKEGYGTATTDWMTTEPVYFTSTIDATGLSGAGYILIQNNDPSDGEGGPAKKIMIPVIFENNSSLNNIYKEDQFKKITRSKYSFYAPSEWIEFSTILSGAGKFTGCELYSISYGGDGHAAGGSIGIQLNSCVKMSNIPGIKENTNKDGYLIYAMYDKDSGTTLTEELKTKEVYKKVVETFTTNQKMMTVKLYFSNTIFNPEMMDCGLVYPVERVIPYTEAVARASLEELIKGPTKEEKELGYFMALPVGTKINSINIKDGILSVDFNAEADGGGGSCYQFSKISSLTTTLKQFSTVKDFKFSVEGSMDPFQP